MYQTAKSAYCQNTITTSENKVLNKKRIKRVMEIDAHRPSDPGMEPGLVELQSLHQIREDWEKKAKAILIDTGGEVLIKVGELLKEAGRINSYLPSEGFLSKAMKESRDWLRELEKMNSAEYYPYFNDLLYLIRQGRQLPLHLDEVNKLENYLEAAKNQKAKIRRIFLDESSSVNLLGALCPRNFINYLKIEHGIFHFTDDMDPGKFVALFKEAELKIMEFIKTLRSNNANKLLDPNANGTFCICLRGPCGVMMKCELCKDWFHSTCVQLPKVASLKYKGSSSSAALHLDFKDCKFLCPNCHRTKRPRLDAILMLVISLQKLYVRVPEGEALQTLTELAMNWQDRARQLLQSPELVLAKNKFCKLRQKFTEATAMQCSESMGSKLKLTYKNIQDDGNRSEQCALDGKDSAASNRDQMGDSTYSLDLSRFSGKEYTLRLNHKVRKKIEESLLEGDLLEVSFDETFELWRLLQASRDPSKEPTLLDFGSCSISAPIKSGFKRHFEDLGGQNKSKAKETERRTKLQKTKDRTRTTTMTSKKGNIATKRKGRFQQTRSSGEDDEHDEDRCAASDGCLKPTEQNVDWVQCDGGCDKWFHMTCVGLVAQDVKKHMDFICTSCFRRNI